MTSALYTGVVVHQRFKPRRHRLRYRLAQMLFDLDSMPSQRLFSHNRFNLVSFHDRDHLDGSGGDLRIQVERALAQAGLRPDGGAIRLLCMPRILGHAFNPITVFFCHRRLGTETTPDLLGTDAPVLAPLLGLVRDSPPLSVLADSMLGPAVVYSARARVLERLSALTNRAAPLAQNIFWLSLY